MTTSGRPFSFVEDHAMHEEDGTVSTGVRTVGAPTAAESTSEVGPKASRAEGSGGGRKRDQPVPSRQPGRPARPKRGLFLGVCALAVLGLLGTIVFGLLWAGSSASSQTDPAMQQAARAFLVDLTNFNAKSVDADFNSINAMATGTFSSQATKFFNSSIRSALESALAESRGQIRNLYVQTDSGSKASVYAVVDQVYVNNKISTPQSDVLRVLVNLAKVGSTWKISDVTVLEGATPASTGSPSGAAGSTVPGQ
jgi:hypothetical protein